MSYKDPEKRKIYHREYYQLHKTELKAYKASHREERKAYDTKYRQSPKGKTVRRRTDVRRKQFGFIILNEWFEGCEGHHIDNKRMIYIPKELHRSIWHSLSLNINMDKINKLAFDYLESEQEE